MTAIRIYIWIFSILSLVKLVGCVATEPIFEQADLPSLENIEYEPGSADAAVSGSNMSAPAPSAASLVTPFSVRGARAADWQPPEAWDLTIEEAIQIALANSTVLRDLGARVIQAPVLTPTIYGPAIQSTDPRFGVEAALSAFDAQVTSDLFYESNDRVLNNRFLGGGVNFFRQDLGRFQYGLSKRAATGTSFALRHNVESDANNAELNLFERAWSWNLEGEVRQPLLQGSGTAFNRIAGPGAVPGNYNGVVVAMLETDARTAELEIALRDYLSDVENAYWDLKFAYIDLETKRKARDRSLDTLRNLEGRVGLPNAERDKLAQAKEQYFRSEQAVQDALGGRLVLGSRNFNGSGGGTFQGTGGVYSSERRLRMIMGLPINDGRLIHATSTPPEAPTIHDWEGAVATALRNRTELRRQQLLVERRSMELAASRNFTLPQLDAVGRYRYRGLGDHLYDPRAFDGTASTSTNTHEWLLGLSLSYPVGYRQAYAAVRNAELRLSRERELLEELQRQVVFGISNAVAEKDRAYEALRLAINRQSAAREQYELLVPDPEDPVTRFDFNALLDAEQRLAAAETNRNRAEVQYALATKNVHFEMGTLLEYLNIHIASVD